MITLPYLDATGTITPALMPYLVDGATADHHPTDRNLIVVTFKSAKDLAAFKKAIGAAEESAPE
jgi:hypothetical protein